MKLLFFSNLSDANATTLAKETGPREAVLLSPSVMARRTSEAARAIKSRGLQLAADNGNTGVIFKVAAEFVPQAVKLKGERLKAEQSEASKGKRTSAAGLTAPEVELDEMEAFQEQGLEAAQLFEEQLSALQSNEASGRSSFMQSAASVSKESLEADYKALAEAVAKRCADLITAEHQEKVLAAQANVQPDFFTSLEDLSVPIMVQLDIEPEYTGQPASTFINLQKRGLQIASGILRKKFGPFAGIPYATLHSFDYDSAFQVGAQAADIKGLEGIATGLASFLCDRNFISSYQFKGQQIELKSKIPRRYLRAVMVTLGLMDGFASKRGALPRFHGLGVGSPLLLSLLALCGYGSPYFSVDSTAPEKNASMGNINTLSPSPGTMTVEEIAQSLVDGKMAWDCPCPYCASVQEKLPFNLEKARKFYQKNIAPGKIERRHLLADDGVGQFLSLCWETKSQPAKKSIYQARVNHSQWTMTELVRQLREHASSYSELRRFVGAQCEVYKKTVPRPLALQMDECLKVIDQLRPLTGSTNKKKK